MLIKSRVEALGLDYDKIQQMLDKADELDEALTAAVTARRAFFSEASKPLVYVYPDGDVDRAGDRQLWCYLMDERCFYTVCRADDAAAIAAIRRQNLEALALRQREKLEATLKALKELQ